MALEIADVAVIGGGPAGAAASRLLASWGRRVVLINRSATPRPLGESIPPSCIKLFDQIGIRQRVDDAGFIRATGNTVQWGGKERSVESFELGQLGYQVARDAFDDVLLAASEGVGTIVRRDSTVVDVAREQAGGWAVHVSEPAGSATIQTQWVLDCSGRAGVVARRDLRRPMRAARTIAVVGIWERGEGWPGVDPTHTLVESYDEGWAWSVPISSSRRYVTVMLDPSITTLATRTNLVATYLAELRRTTMLSELVEGATLTDSPWGCDASPYSAVRVDDEQLLLVGDAGSFVDPLSSFGIKKALASAWLAAVVVHTALGDVTLASPAVDLFARREEAMYEHLQRQSALLSREAAGAHASSYWSNRGDVDEAPIEGELDAARLREDTRVLSAFEELRRRPSIHLRAADSLEFVDRPMVRGNRVVLERHLSDPAFTAPVRFCRGIDLVLMTDLSARHDQVPDLFDAYNRVAPPAPLPDFLGALSTLIGFGVLSFA